MAKTKQRLKAEKKRKFVILRMAESEHIELTKNALTYTNGNISTFMRCAVSAWTPNPQQQKIIDELETSECRFHVIKRLEYNRKRSINRRIKMESLKLKKELALVRLMLEDEVERAKKEMKDAGYAANN